MMAGWVALSTVALEEMLRAISVRKTCGTSAAPPTADSVGYKLPEATGQHVLCFLLLLLPVLGIKIWTWVFSTPCCTSEFLPVMLNRDILIWYYDILIWLVRDLSLFLMILCFTRGLRAAMMPVKWRRDVVGTLGDLCLWNIVNTQFGSEWLNAHVLGLWTAWLRFGICQCIGEYGCVA